MKCCAEAVSTSILLHKGQAMLHLIEPTFRLRGDHWQNCGSDKSASSSHTTHVGITLVRPSFLLLGQQLHGKSLDLHFM